MKVRLTKKMVDELRALATPLHEEWIDDTYYGVSDRMVEVRMPPIGWKTLSDLIVERAFTPAGYRKGGKEIAGAALRRISKELAALESHPALRGQALPGAHLDSILVWGLSPYPQEGVEPSYLVPLCRRFKGMMVTEWKQYRPVDWLHGSKILSPGAHWDFIRPADTPASWPTP